MKKILLLLVTFFMLMGVINLYAEEGSNTPAVEETTETTTNETANETTNETTNKEENSSPEVVNEEPVASDSMDSAVENSKEDAATTESLPASVMENAINVSEGVSLRNAPSTIKYNVTIMT